MTHTVSSADGTKIVYDAQGEGPALILVDGALCTRWSGVKPAMADFLAPHFTVYCYDRRGRGDSTDTLPYAVEREVEDLDAVIGEAGGTAFLAGHSSGGSLVLEAAARLGAKVPKLAVYEAPYNDDPQSQQRWSEYVRELTTHLANGRRGDAVAAFMRLTGTPAEKIGEMRTMPFWAGLEAMAPTLGYDHAGLLGTDGAVPAGLAASVTAPALVMSGGASFPFMAETARTLSQLLPQAELRTLPGQRHEVDPEVLGQALLEFFTA